MRKPQVLVAGTARALRIVSEALADSADLVSAVSAAEARQRCGAGIELVVTHITFDESRMLEYVQSLRASAANRDVPVVCLRLFGQLSEARRRGIVNALGVLGNARLIDLYEMREQAGEDAARRQLKELLLQECARLRA